MLDNQPYQPPQSDLKNSTIAPFYIVSETKFLLLAISTLGLYFPYWFFRQWQQQKLVHRENTWPIARGIFAIFFIHALFNRIQNSLLSQQKNFDWAPSVMATVYIVFSVLGALLDRLGDGHPNQALFAMLSISTLIPVVFVTKKAQQAANLASDDPQGISNQTITPANTAWIAFGSFMWVILVLGIYVLTTGLPIPSADSPIQ